MELRQLQYFVKVARKQHVTQAAEELHIAQSAVSRQIHHLEDELGIQLFVQHGRNLHLTPAGKLFLKRVEVVLADLDRAVLEMHELTSPDHGEIRIGFPHTLGIHLVPKLVAEYLKQYPNVRFKFKQGNYEALLNYVAQGEVDLALTSPCPVKDSHVAGDALLTEELFVVVPSNHAFVNRESIILSDLKDESFILFSEGYSLRNIVWNACVKAGFEPNIAFEGEETDTIRGLVAAGMGISLLPEMALTGQSDLMPVKIPIASEKVSRTIGIVRRKNAKLPLLSETFRKFCLDYFE
jgi:LysR family transcriptional activator of glutamate synthase operon